MTFDKTSLSFRQIVLSFFGEQLLGIKFRSCQDIDLILELNNCCRLEILVIDSDCLMSSSSQPYPDSFQVENSLPDLKTL